MYQSIFDLLPKKKEYFASPYQYREGFFFGFHDVTPFSFDETKLLSNQNRLDLRMPLPTEGLDVGYFELGVLKIKKNICDLTKSKYFCGGNYHAMVVNRYDRSYDNMFILYNHEEGRYIIFS